MKKFNSEIEESHKKLTPARRKYWHDRGINDETLDKFKIGYNEKTGFYIFPYFDNDGNCYAYKAINEKKEQYWVPKDEENVIRIFNLEDIDKARGSDKTIFIAEGEKDCMVLKQQGYLSVGVSGCKGFIEEYKKLFEGNKDIVVCYDNDDKGKEGAEKVAELLGYRARIIDWPEWAPKDINDLYIVCLEGEEKDFNQIFDDLVGKAQRVVAPIFSHMPTFSVFKENLRKTQLDEMDGIKTGFSSIDKNIGGFRGITVIGGAPKIGKSTLALCVATNIAHDGNTVIYFDFENGLKRILLRLVSRLSGISIEGLLTLPDILTSHDSIGEIDNIYSAVRENLFIYRPNMKNVNRESSSAFDVPRMLLEWIINAIREELNIKGNILIIIDSLQKLPLPNISDRRASIDAWLRAIEWARDEKNVTFLIISELSRGAYDTVSLDAFKESGDIEYTADIALQMVRNDDKKQVELHCIANRDGATGFIGAYTHLYKVCDFEELPNVGVCEEVAK